MQNTIKSCKELNREIISQGDSNLLLAYRGFLLLKTLDNGSGFIEINRANKAFRLFLGKNYSVNVLSRLPESNDFWQQIYKGVFVKSWDKVWDKFDVIPTEWAILPINTLKNKRVFTSNAYVNWLHGKTISRETLSELWGFTKTTQIKYERKLLVHTEKNYFQLTEHEASEACALETINPNALFKTSEGYLAQLPNTYYGYDVERFSTRSLRIKNAERKDKLVLSDSSDKRLNCFPILFLNDTHNNNYGKPAPKKYDGTKTLLLTHKIGSANIYSNSGGTYIYSQ